MSNDAEPTAFPGLTQRGLTKREYIATQIAAGIAANSIPGSHHVPSQLAADAVDLADELIKRLEGSSA